MGRILASIARIGGFLLIWALLTALATASVVGLGGRDFYFITPYRVALEALLTISVLIALVAMALWVDKRRLSSIGFASARLPDLLAGAVLGAAIFIVPLALLFAFGLARFEPDLGRFEAQALAIGLVICLFNVVTQEALVRSYIFQELWAKYGAWTAAIATTLFFLALHAGPISHGAQGVLAGANILLASVMLSLAYVRTGSLWLPIGLHLGWNGLQGPVLHINVTGNDLGFGHWSVISFSASNPLLTGGDIGVEGGLAGLAGPAAGIALVALLFKQAPKPDFSSKASGTA